MATPRRHGEPAKEAVATEEDDDKEDESRFLLDDLAQIRDLYASNHLSDVLFVFPNETHGSNASVLKDLLPTTTTTSNTKEDLATRLEALDQLHQIVTQEEMTTNNNKRKSRQTQPQQQRQQQLLLLPAHRLVLALRSGAFRQAFTHAKSSKLASQVRFPIKVCINDVSFPIFATLLRFLYTNELVVVESKSETSQQGHAKDPLQEHELEQETYWKDLLWAAFVYVVPRLVQICVSHLLEIFEKRKAENHLGAGTEQTNSTGVDRNGFELEHLQRVLQIVIFCEQILTTTSVLSPIRRSVSNSLSPQRGDRAKSPVGNVGDDPAENGYDELVKRCLASIERLQQACLKDLKGAADHVFELLVHSEVGRKCSTGKLCEILRLRSPAPLVVAIQYQLGRAVNELLRQGESLDATGENGKLPLVTALETGNDAIVRRLLVDENAPFYLLTERVPLFFLACASGNATHCQVLLDLLEDEVNVNLISPLENTDKEIMIEFGKRMTPLHIAARKGHDKVVSFLLQHKAVSNLQDEEGNTPLHYAANIETAEALLSKSVRTNPNIPNRRGQTALHVAAASGDVGVVDVLLRNGAEEDALDDQGQNAFHVAAANGHTAVALILLRQRENSAEEQRTGKKKEEQETDNMKAQDLQPSSIANRQDVDAVISSNGSTSSRSQISSEDQPSDLSKQLDINQADLKGNTALHLAAMSPPDRCQKMVQLLLEYGADPSRTNWFGYTPLHLFCAHQSGPAVVIESFIEHGVNIHTQSLDGSTALHLAVGNASESVCVALVASGAQVHLEDAAGRSVVDLAESTNQGRMLVPILRNLAVAPEWIADDQIHDCASCHTTFRVAMRKHHCRHCGRVICYNCSTNSIEIPKFDITKPVRICDVCFEVLSFQRLV